MKRLLLSIALTGIVLIGSGCLAVSATETSRVNRSKQVVAVGNRVYLVDTKTGEADEIDISHARVLKSPGVMPEPTASDQ